MTINSIEIDRDVLLHSITNYILSAIGAVFSPLDPLRREAIIGPVTQKAREDVARAAGDCHALRSAPWIIMVQRVKY